MAKDISNKTLALLLVAAIAVSVLGIYASTSGITGASTAQNKTATVNVSTLIAYEAADNQIEFGLQLVPQGDANCYVDSNLTGNCTGATINDTWITYNFGNVPLNITGEEISPDVTGLDWEIWVDESFADDGCTDNKLTSWTSITSGVPFDKCGCLCPDTGANRLYERLKVTIARDVPPDVYTKIVEQTAAVSGCSCP